MKYLKHPKEIANRTRGDEGGMEFCVEGTPRQRK